jgi:glycosyltransferase involved in cell wall biosynthesis
MTCMKSDWNNPKDAPSVTVRITTYNQARFIRACIEGVLMQVADFPVEILIHDDASTDGTSDIVREYADRYPDFIRAFVRKRNQRSLGKRIRTKTLLRLSRGKYTALCEGDDYWTDPQKLQKQVDVLEARPECSLCFHNARVVYDGKPSKEDVFIRSPRQVYTVEDVILEPWFVPTQSMLYRTAWEVFPTWRRHIANGDLGLQLCLADQGPFCCLPDLMSVYRKHGSSLSAKKNWAYWQLMIMRCYLYFDAYSDYRHHAAVETRLRALADDLYRLQVLRRPFWVRCLSFDYYAFRVQGVRLRIQAIKADHPSATWWEITRALWYHAR